MDALSTETKREIIRRVFPDLRYGGDPDIERYFELRRDRRLAEALGVYNARLRVRYPDDAKRITLLRLFRERDPRYAAYQESLILKVAERLAVRIASNIDLIVSQLGRIALTDAFAALKAVESVLARFGGDSEAALAQLAQYEAFSKILNHKSVLARRALELVREYDAVARADSPADYDFIARSAAMEERRRASRPVGRGASATAVRDERYDFVAMSAAREARAQSGKQARTNFFDPSKITFSVDEKKRIEVPDRFRKREDRVLVYCAKYWNQVKDPAFDRLIFLYSRKFGGTHYEIFRTIKTGRLRGSNDDEILSAVSAILTTSYSYSVSGDLYMQVMWRRLRSRMQAQAVEYRLSAPGPESRVRAAHAERRKETGIAETASRVRREDMPSEKAVPEKPERVGRISVTTSVADLTRSRNAVLRADPDPGKEPTPHAGLLKSTTKATGTRLLVRTPSGPDPVPVIRGKGGSVSDRIRALSGKSYDVYREIFLDKVRDHIHRYLLSHRTRSHGLFDTAANEAEDHVFGFISAHYDDPFMDWGHSAERNLVEALGFVLPTLDPIVQSCFSCL